MNQRLLYDSITTHHSPLTTHQLTKHQSLNNDIVVLVKYQNIPELTVYFYLDESLKVTHKIPVQPHGRIFKKSLARVKKLLLVKLVIHTAGTSTYG